MTLKNIVDILVNQIRIFPVDIIPLGLINTKSCVERIRDVLSMSEVGMLPSVDGKTLLFFVKVNSKKTMNLLS